jgi:hypothetical protein
MAAIAPFLEPHVTVRALDRLVEPPAAMLRSTARNGEYEDVAAVVDAVAVASGEQVDVYGYSHDGIVAFGADAGCEHPQTGP